jgi:hypothetical protein
MLFCSRRLLTKVREADFYMHKQKHSHKQVTTGLVDIGGVGSYLDLEFRFSNDAHRTMTIRLLFCDPSLDPAAAETMHRMIGDEVRSLSVQVVSFYDRMQEEVNPDKIYEKPEGRFDLYLHELNYLYDTIVDFMFKVAENERIEILYFAAENETLNRVYSRYVKRYADQRNLTFLKDGASYAIRT